MKKLFLIGFLLFSCFSLQAQTNLDSLFSVWQDETQSDSLRSAAYFQYILDGFLYSRPDSAFLLADELMYFATEKQYAKAEAQAFKIKGVSTFLIGDFLKALAYFKRDLKVREEIGDKKAIASSLNNIGGVYFRQGNSDKALDYFRRSLKVSEEVGEKRLVAATIMNIGSIYLTQGNDKQALEYLERSLKSALENGDKSSMADVIINLGGIYSRQGNNDKALDSFQQGLKLKEETGDVHGMAAALSNIGTLFSTQGKYQEALEYFERSLKLTEEIGDKNGIASTLQLIGVNNQLTKNFSEAIRNCEKSLAISEEIEALDLQKEVCSCLYQAYKGLGNGTKALVYHEQMQIINDSLNAQETNKKLQQMEFEKQVLADSLATAEKERLVEQAHREEVRQKNQTRNILFGGGLLLLILAGGLFGRMRFIRKSKAVLQIETDRSENLLLNILPADIAAELKEKGRADARDFDMVSILFTDFKGFTEASEKLTAQELVAEINTCFEAFDGIMGKYNIEKIKTIGDAYMAAGGLPVPTDDSVKDTVLAALEMQAFVAKRKKVMDAKGLPSFEMRVGIHTGPVVAGIVGVKKFAYDIWGDTVNTASRMESAGAVGKVNISQATYEFLTEWRGGGTDESDFIFENRGEIETKGKGAMEMWFVSLKTH